ncbi:MAG: hypothetical protein JZU64_13915 [Rhodoferax sp.]|jgi:hypothetical protein|nr:hypothetical protein [Rhodoferax sp.]
MSSTDLSGAIQTHSSGAILTICTLLDDRSTVAAMPAKEDMARLLLAILVQGW